MSQKIYTDLDIKGNTTIGSIANATTDTDKFLVSDNGLVKYRTGAEMLSDLGVAPGVASNVQHQVKAEVAINKGQAVYVTSADGTNMIVGLASNTSEATSSKTMGLLDSTVAINGFANVITEGLLAGLNTIGATAGDPVWLGTDGNLIYGLINKPYAPAHLVFIGIVTRVNASNGEIFVKVQNGFELNEIHDVDLKTTTPVNGDILGFNGTLWVNKTIAAWLGYTPANASGTTNYVAKFTGTTSLGNSQIFDNGTSVGINTTTPSANNRLEVDGRTFISAGTDGTTTAPLIVRNTIPYSGSYNQFLQFWQNSAGSNIMSLRADGGLTVSGTTQANTLRLVGAGTNTTNEVMLSRNGQNGTGLSFLSGHQITFTSNSNERMRLDSGGNFVIGATTAGARLDVRAQGALATDIAFRVRNSADTQNFLVVNGAGDVYNNGAMGITSNTFFGEFSGRSSTGANNSFFGDYAGFSNTTGGSNAAVGNNAMSSNTSGNANSAFGVYSLLNIIGNNNIGIGFNAGRFLADGTTALTLSGESIFIGNTTKANGNSQSNQIVIGHNATGLGSNTVVLGNDIIVTTALKGNVGIGTTTPSARLDVRAQGALVTDIAFRVRNSTDTANLLSVNGQGTLSLGLQSSAPTGIEGAIYYDSVTKKHYGYNGTTWNAFY